MNRIVTVSMAAAIVALGALPPAAIGAPARHHQNAVLKASLAAIDGKSGDSFGSSVAINGNTIVVGAPLHTVKHHKRQGAVYVFVRHGAGWAHLHQVAELTVPHGKKNDYLGRSVAITGNSIVAGAPYRTISGDVAQGAAYVWTKPAGGWGAVHRPAAQLVPSDGTSNDQFGLSVAASGASIAVGAPGHVVGFHQTQGAVDIFTKHTKWSGNVINSAQLIAPDGEANDQLGTAISLDGGELVAGAPYHRVGSHQNEGAAYVFSKGGPGWRHTTTVATLTQRDGAKSDFFGDGVVIKGSTIAVDAPYRKVAEHKHQGAASVFVMPKSGWSGDLTQQATLTVKPGATNAYSGLGLAISGRSIIVSGYGLASIFNRPKAGWSGTRHQAAALVAGAPGQFIGASIAASDNVIVAGAPTATPGKHAISGASFVYVK